jgi:uncharacterized membrane protein YfcA
MGAMDLPSTLSGFAVGTIVGLTGVGGGSLPTPLLVLLPGIWLARHAFARVPEQIRRRLPAAILVPIGGKLVFA